MPVTKVSFSHSVGMTAAPEEAPPPPPPDEALPPPPVEAAPLTQLHIVDIWSVNVFLKSFQEASIGGR
jgi:hypothetical protein